MPSWDVRLISVSYRRDGPAEEPVIQLYGRTREGRSLAAEHRGFQPYFYVRNMLQSLRGAFEHDPGVVRQEDVSLLVAAKPTPCVKVTLRHPWRTPDYRNKAKGYGCEVLAADIPFAHRFVYDKDLAACVTIQGRESDLGGRYTTELRVEAEGFAPCEPFNPTLKILSFDIENNWRDGHIYCLAVTILDEQGMRSEVLDGPEKQILERFIETVIREDPDVITGYNIDNYDLRVLRDRAAHLGIQRIAIGRDRSEPVHIYEQFWRLDGRVVADAWWSVKIEVRPKQETLDYVSRLLLNDAKLDVDRTRLDEEWAANPGRVKEYCIKDAELALRLLVKVKRLEKSLDLSTVSKLPLDDVVNGRTSNFIDSILIREADRAGVGVPMMRTKGGGESIEGGYVHSLDAGLYDWVAVLDFRSQYPSIIIEKNICFTTLSEDGTTVSPIGVRFLSKDQREGLLPQILARLMRERSEIRRRISEDPERRAYYDGLQNAVKVLMNAFYGVLASTFYRFTDPKIGASITAYGRENVKGVISQLEAEGVKVLYADTDSCFWQSPFKDLPPDEARDKTVALGKQLAERFSRGSIQMEFEKVMRTFFTHGKKKRYAGKVVWPREEFVVRGYEIRRTDAFELQSEAQRELFELILDGKTEAAVERAKEIVQAVRRGIIPLAPEGTDPLERLVISRTVKEEATYVNPESMTNVQAFRKMKELGYEVMTGMKVSWIVTDGKKTPQEVEPFISGRPVTVEPDWEYYARRLSQTLSYITEVYGWDERSLVSGVLPPKQATLMGEGFAGGEGPTLEEAPRRTAKKQTLEDYF